MRAGKKEKVILYLKNNQMNWTDFTQQTIKLRDKTNEKIRLLGNRYYIIKTLFDKYNFKRDDIFLIGKELENEYKDVKENIHLQNQLRRMKEALYCWYTEHFFDELFQPNSVILKRMIAIRKNAPPASYKAKTKSHTTTQQKTIRKKRKANKTNETPKTNDVPQIVINQEVDSFDFSNLNSENKFDAEIGSVHANDNFNFNNFLNF
ncbi:hypothetical protein M9Y10_002323 [Tritrichomonas musculus]|uniref:Uncharacterized protein n=1 Tax=Tritrichomonas musculus TaxID=1915356 RepID=A0ABR2L9H0_9EUKA